MQLEARRATDCDHPHAQASPSAWLILFDSGLATKAGHEEPMSATRWRDETGQSELRAELHQEINFIGLRIVQQPAARTPPVDAGGRPAHMQANRHHCHGAIVSIMTVCNSGM
jgi:hypothetical protein